MEKRGVKERGVKERGVRRSGVWRSGVWRSGVWRSGVWRSEVWKSGVWKSGVKHANRSNPDGWPAGNKVLRARTDLLHAEAVLHAAACSPGSAHQNPRVTSAAYASCTEMHPIRSQPYPGHSSHTRSPPRKPS